ncbi:MAG: arginyltransferase [Candidatus Tectimicrobiota bacterium]
MAQSLQLLELAHYTPPPYRCPYLPTETARLTYRLLLDATPAQHEGLLQRGWRRFGREWFRPRCPSCSACRSLRLPLARFTPSRSQRRTLQRNAHIDVVVQPPTLTAAHLQLYDAYHADMHQRRGWPWHRTNPQDYFHSYVDGNWDFAREFLFYDQQRLVGVGLADVTPEALSSVYFFHDPAWRPRAPGVFAVLQQLAYAQQQGLRYQYLGYWIAACPSMAYKAQYRPHEILQGYPPDHVEPVWRLA